MSNLAIRMWLAAAVMSFGWFGTAWVRSGNAFEVKPLSQSLDMFPMEVDGYQGTEVPLDDQVLEVLKADATINRHYVRPDGTSMKCHFAAWLRPEDVIGGVPHLPNICYSNTGWKIIGEKSTEIATPAGRLKMNLLLVERDAGRAVVAYWYQIGDLTYTTTADGKRNQRKLWGEKRWPALVKVLLDTPAHDIESALPRMETFASSVFTWTREL